MKHFLPAPSRLLWLLALWLPFQKSLGQTPTLQFAHALQTAHDQGVWSRATATDSQGNFYMTGLFHGTVDFDTSTADFPLVYQGGTAHDTDGESDVFIAKYSTNGTLLWAKRLLEPTFSGMNEERASAMIVDNNNNLFLTGFTNTRGFFVSKWDSEGNELWTKYFDDTETNNVVTFALRKNNNAILISGIFADVLDFDPSPTGTTELTAFNNDGFLLSLSESGNFEWVKQFRCNGGVFITGLETDSANNIFLSGIFLGSVDLNPSTTASTIITSQSISAGAISSAFLAKFNVNGELLWNRHLSGTSTTDIFMAFLKKDKADNMILTGSFKGETTLLPTGTSLNTNGFYASFLAKYSNDGNLLWSNLFGTPTATQASAFPSSFCANVITDDCNNIYVSGEFLGNCDFNPAATDEKVLSTLTNLIGAFAAAYTPNGEHLWSLDVGGLGNMAFVEFNGYLPIALDSNNDLIFTGTFRGQIDADPSSGSVLLNSTSAANTNIAGIFMAKYDNPIANCALATNPPTDTKTFSVYPNPSSGRVTLYTAEFREFSTVTVYDISGKKLATFALNSEETVIDLGHLSQGIYLLELRSGHKTAHQKLILK